MPKYRVFIEQFVSETCEVEVEAETVEQAIEKAQEEASDGEVIWESSGDTKDLGAFLVYEEGKKLPVWDVDDITENNEL